MTANKAAQVPQWYRASKRRGQRDAVTRVEEPLGSMNAARCFFEPSFLLLADEVQLLAVVVESLQHRRIDGQRQRPKARREIDRLVRVGVLDAVLSRSTPR